uniref:Uncharacterized protein n=1 Tax=Solanum lycopersicum TaxID=4081 RepID=A0A3Q7EC11_SOLLC
MGGGGESVMTGEDAPLTELEVQTWKARARVEEFTATTLQTQLQAAAGDDDVKVFSLVKFCSFKVACQLFMSIEDHNDVEKLFLQFNIFLKGLYAIPLNLPGTTFYKAIRATDSGKEEKPWNKKQLHLHKTFCLICCHFLMKMESICLSTLKFIKTFCKKMKYSWNVICEVMRITPPILGAYREAIVDINYEGYDIPKGWKNSYFNSFMLEQLHWNTGLTSLDPEIFPNSWRLVPSRFEEDGPAPYTYITSGG